MFLKICANLLATIFVLVIIKIGAKMFEFLEVKKFPRGFFHAKQVQRRYFHANMSSTPSPASRRPGGVGAKPPIYINNKVIGSNPLAPG